MAYVISIASPSPHFFHAAARRLRRPQEKANFETRRGEVTAIMGGYVTLSLSLSLCGSTGSSHVSYLLRYVEIGERGETGGGPVRPSRDSFARCDFRFHLVDPNRHGTARNGMESHKLHLDKAPECGWQPSRSRGEAFRCSFRTFGKSVNMGYKTTLFIRKATLPS